MSQLRWLITGCSSGLGEALVLKALARGDKVVATARGDGARLSALQDAGAETISLDVTSSPENIVSVVQQILENGSIDVLVNNAGYAEVGLAEEVSYKQYSDVFETNFLGAIKITQAVLPHFRAKRAGCVLSIGSVGGLEGLFAGSAYSASKFALEGWHDTLRQELAPFNIKTAILELGFFRTPFMSPEKAQYSPNPIGDYDDLRSQFLQIMKAGDGTQIGDPEKAVKIIVDLVRGEGVAEGKMLPGRLPLGPDSLEVMRKRAVSNLALCNEWEDVIRSTNFD